MEKKTPSDPSKRASEPHQNRALGHVYENFWKEHLDYFVNFFEGKKVEREKK